MNAVAPIPELRGARFFSDAQRAQLEAVMEAIWPGGEDHPGARDAGAADYVDQLLALPDEAYYEIERWRPLYVAGLAMLSAAAVQRFGGAATLPTLPRADMTALLRDLAAGPLAGFPDAGWQRTFFSTMRAHCIEGCLSDPRWGGNRDGVIWSWLGYPYGPARSFDRAAGGLA
jgi:hypothetical protein